MRIQADFRGVLAYGTSDCQHQLRVDFLLGLAFFELMSKPLFPERTYANVEFQLVEFISRNLGASILEESHDLHSPFAAGRLQGDEGVWICASFLGNRVHVGPIEVNQDLEH